jgi:hypothetical protein
LIPVSPAAQTRINPDCLAAANRLLEPGRRASCARRAVTLLQQVVDFLPEHLRRDQRHAALGHGEAGAVGIGVFRAPALGGSWQRRQPPAFQSTFDGHPRVHAGGASGTAWS